MQLVNLSGENMGNWRGESRADTTNFYGERGETKADATNFYGERGESRADTTNFYGERGESRADTTNFYGERGESRADTTNFYGERGESRADTTNLQCNIFARVEFFADEMKHLCRWCFVLFSFSVATKIFSSHSVFVSPSRSPHFFFCSP